MSQPLFLNALSLGSSVRKEEDTIGFSLLHADTTLGLDALSVNDLTLWKSRISEAISDYSTVERKFLTKQKSGNFVYFIDFAIQLPTIQLMRMKQRSPGEGYS